MNKDDVLAYDTKFPEKDYKKLTFDFNTQELRELMGFDPIMKMGQIAQSMMSQIINTLFLKRVGIASSPDVGVLYDVTTGKAIVYVPKVLCSKCNVRKAAFQYEGKVFCQSCADLLKQELSVKKEVEKEKKIEKKEKGEREEKK